MPKKSSYAELRARQQQEFESFPCFFAFSDKQFKEGMQTLGVSSEEDLFRYEGGMFYRRSDADALHKLLDRMDLEMQEAFKDDAFFLDAVKYEMANHEYCIMHDDYDVVSALGFSLNEVDQDSRMSKLFLKAKKEYLKEYERSNSVR